MVASVRGFNAASREVVDTVYAKAIELGGKCEGPPGVRGPDPNGIYARMPLSLNLR